MSGRVVFIGAGPGSADLITLRGAQRLAQADVVLFDALTDPALRSLAPQARWIDVGKRGCGLGSGQASRQPHINGLLVRLARQHALVARLKGGDPSVFGRLEEELQALAAAGITAEVVPGVTAACAAAAEARRPLTRRGAGRSVCLSTAMTQQGHLRAARQAETEVIYMAGAQLAALSRALLRANWPAATPVCVVSRAGWPDALVSQHQVSDLAEATLLHGGRPAIVTVGTGASAVSAVSKTMTLDAAQADARPMPA